MMPWSNQLHPFLLAFTGVQVAMFSIFVAILTMVMISTRNRTQRSMQTPRHTARERYAAATSQRTSLREVEEVMLELDKLAREVNGRLDIRFAKLEAIIRDADERIAKYERLTRATGATDAVDPAPRLDVTLGEEQPDAATPPPRMEDSPHAEVYRLADAGMTDIQIAEETGKTTGEIELILTLRKAQGAPSHSPAASSPAEATG